MIDAKTAAKIAKCSLSTIYNLLRNGTIPSKRVGSRGRGCYRLEPSDVQKWLESCKVQSSQSRI